MVKVNKKHTNEEEKRINAINRYVKGEVPSKICKNFGVSRKWLYKWLKRYRNANGKYKDKWFKEKSRAPKSVQRKTNSEIEKAIVEIRKSLMEGKTEDTKYRCIGAVEIQFRMHQLEYLESEIPSTATISRIVKRNKLVIQKRKRYVRCKSKKRYTLLNPTKINEAHQVDFIGPRYIKGYGAISSLNLIDVASNKAEIQQYTSRNMDFVIGFLLDCWTKNAIPKYLQMDNGAYFIGDLKHPRHFSRVVRLCLYFNVEPVFIAPRKPWMNGLIEDFNGDFNDKLWGKEEFIDLDHVRRESKIFLKRHNDRQEWKNRKSNLETILIRKIPKSFKIDVNNLPITKGKTHFIRQVEKDGTVNVLNEDFLVDKSLAYEYVWTTINTKKQELLVYYHEKKAKEVRLVKIHKYKINEKVVSIGFKH